MKSSSRTYDFLIATCPRSGSHLLASLLDSHPDIECDGEFMQNFDRLTKAKPDTTKIRGAIMMYRDTRALERFLPKRFIYLTRNNIHAAKSALLNRSILKSTGRSSHRAHRFKGQPPINDLGIVVSTIDIYELAQSYEKNHDHLLETMNRLHLPVFHVRYEELVQDPAGITECPQAIAEQLCNFLAVPYHKLTTKYRRGQAEERQ